MTNDDKSTHESVEYPADAMFTDVLNEPCGSDTCPFCNPKRYGFLGNDDMTLTPEQLSGQEPFFRGKRFVSERTEGTEFVGWFA